MKTCVLCHNRKEEVEFGEHYGNPNKTCEACLGRLKGKARRRKEADKPIPPVTFEVLREAYHMTDEEAHAVDMAAGQSLSRVRFKKKHPHGKWPGPSGDAVIDGLGGPFQRRRELLGAASLRAREIIEDQGMKVATFFSQRN
ncbi:MAG: hypothetical protein KAJ55_00120 [Anaerolineales bacterium]|nr:hypothetical protein [Anaerolineales bacterium]